MKRSLAQQVFRDGAVYAVAGVLSQGIAFLLFPFFAHVFGPAEYGVIDLLGVIMMFAALTVALEVAQGLGRHFAELTDHDDRRTYVSTAFSFTVLCFTAFAVVTIVAAVPLTEFVLGPEVEPKVWRLGMVVIWCYGIGYLVIDLLRWRMRPRQFALVSVITAVVVTAASAIYVLVLDLGVEGAVLGQLTGFFVGGTIAIVLNRDLLAPRIDGARLRQMLTYSLPLVPASVGVLLNGYADRVAIQTRLELSDVGLYGVGYRLSLVVSLTLIGFQGALLPQLLRTYRDPGTPLQLARVFRLFSALALCVLLLVSTFADEILRVLTPPAYNDAAKVVPFSVGGAFLVGMYIFAPGLNIAKRTKPFAVVTVVGGLANLGLALALVGPLGIEGAALSFLITGAASFAMLMSLSQRLYPVPHQWARLAGGAAFAVVLTGAGWLLDPWSPLKLAVAAVGVGVLAYWLMDADERAMGAGFVRAQLKRA